MTEPSWEEIAARAAEQKERAVEEGIVILQGQKSQGNRGRKPHKEVEHLKDAPVISLVKK